MPIQPKQQPPYYEPRTTIKQFVALMQQTTTNAPVIIQIMLNTMTETPTFARNAVGVYEVDSLTEEEFTPLKTFITLTKSAQSGVPRTLTAGTPNDDDPSYFMINSHQADGNSAEINDYFYLNISIYP